MHANWQDGIRSIVLETMHTFQIPGMVIAVAPRNKPITYLVFGTDAAGEPLQQQTLFPVASITKLATALAVLRLVDAGLLTYDDSIAQYLPDAMAAEPNITIRTLLTHTSGLPSSYPDGLDLYKLGLTWPIIARACLRTPVETPPNVQVRYGGVGYSLLAVVVERLTQHAFPTALQELVCVPLGIEAYLGSEPPRRPASIDVRDYPFTGTNREFYNSTFFRSLGEPASGLVTTIDGVLHLIDAYWNADSAFLQPETVVAATRNQVGDLGGGVEGWFTLDHCPWGFGPALHGTFPWAPREASRTSFGHTGASGCIVWADPVANVAWAVCGVQVPDNGWCDAIFARIGAAILAAVD
jgi:beta-lactamase class C